MGVRDSDSTIFTSVLEKDEYLKCGLCFESLTDPTTLNCKHKLCSRCVNNEDDITCVTCPLCEQVTTMTVQVDVHSTTSKLRKQDNVSDINIACMSRVNNNGLHMCVLCDNGRIAEASCADCSELMCSFCHQSHKNSKASKHHVISMLGDASSDATESTETIQQCENHKQPFTYYCRPCDTIVCMGCRSDNHKGHRTKPTRVIIKDKKQQLEDKIQSTKQKYVESLEKKRQKLGSQINSVKENSNSVVDKILNRAEYLKQQIDQIKEERITDAKAKETTTLCRLNSCREDLDQDKAVVYEQLQLAERILRSGSDLEIVRDSKSLQEALNNAEQNCQNLPEMIKLQFDIGELDLDSLRTGFGCCSTRQTGLLWSRSVSTCTRNLGDITVSLLSKFDCCLACRDDDNNTSCDPIHALVSLEHGQITTSCGWESNKLISTDIQGQLTNKVDVGVTVDDLSVNDMNEVMFSCYRERVVKRIGENGNETEILSLQFRPRGLTATSNGGLLVCLMDEFSTSLMKSSRRMVVKYNSKGEETDVFEYTSDKHRLFTRPYRVMENINGDICVIDKTSMGSGRIVILDADGTLKFVYKGPAYRDDSKPFSPSGMCCDQFGRILVTDTNNHNVHILDKSGQFVGYLLQKDDGILSPSSVLLDSTGNLWIGSEYGVIRIYSYS